MNVPGFTAGEALQAETRNHHHARRETMQEKAMRSRRKRSFRFHHLPRALECVLFRGNVFYCQPVWLPT